MVHMIQLAMLCLRSACMRARPDGGVNELTTAVNYCKYVCAGPRSLLRIAEEGLAGITISYHIIS